MGPLGSSFISTILWFTLFFPYVFGGLVKDYRFRTFMLTVVTPVLVSIYISIPSITPYFLVPWEIMIPLTIVIYGVIMLISLISPKYKNAASGNGDIEGHSYLMITIAIILLLGMLAYYYTALFQFSPLPMEMQG